MKNLVKAPADLIDWTNGTGGDVASGDPVEIVTGNSGMLAVAEVDIADTKTGTVRIKNAIVSLAKKSGESWTQGDPLYWDSGNSALTKTASSYTYAGRAAADAQSADTTGDLLLNQP